MIELYFWPVSSKLASLFNVRSSVFPLPHRARCRGARSHASASRKCCSSRAGRVLWRYTSLPKCQETNMLAHIQNNCGANRHSSPILSTLTLYYFRKMYLYFCIYCTNTYIVEFLFLFCITFYCIFDLAMCLFYSLLSLKIWFPRRAIN